MRTAERAGGSIETTLTHPAGNINDHKPIAFSEGTRVLSNSAPKPDGVGLVFALFPAADSPVRRSRTVADWPEAIVSVILEYLEERVPTPPLLPVGAKARAQARLLEDDADWVMNGAIIDLLAETYRKPDPTTRDQQKIAESAKAITSAFDRLERVLGDGRPHLCGEQFTVSDVAWLLPVSFSAAFGVPPGEAQPALRTWLARIAARPSIAAETKAMREALAKLPD